MPQIKLIMIIIKYESTLNSWRVHTYLSMDTVSMFSVLHCGQDCHIFHHQNELLYPNVLVALTFLFAAAVSIFS